MHDTIKTEGGGQNMHDLIKDQMAVVVDRKDRKVYGFAVRLGLFAFGRTKNPRPQAH